MGSLVVLGIELGGQLNWNVGRLLGTRLTLGKKVGPLLGKVLGMMETVGELLGFLETVGRTVWPLQN